MHCCCNLQNPPYPRGLFGHRPLRPVALCVRQRPHCACLCKACPHRQMYHKRAAITAPAVGFLARAVPLLQICDYAVKKMSKISASLSASCFASAFISCTVKLSPFLFKRRYSVHRSISATAARLSIVNLFCAICAYSFSIFIVLQFFLLEDRPQACPFLR